MYILPGGAEPGAQAALGPGSFLTEDPSGVFHAPLRASVIDARGIVPEESTTLSTSAARLSTTELEEATESFLSHDIRIDQRWC